MSWMFDRLCEIAVADQVAVVVRATVDDASLSGGSSELAEVLARASTVPQLSVTLLPAAAPELAVAGERTRTLDLDELDGQDVVLQIATSIRQQQRSANTALRVRGAEVALSTPCAAESTDQLDGTRIVYATDLPGHAHELRSAAVRGLGIAIGGVDPDASVRVDTFLGVVSIIDALVTLRSFAFGAERDAARPVSSLRGRPAALRPVRCVG